MPGSRKEVLSKDIVDLIGDGPFIALAEAFGGLRHYIPHHLTRGGKPTALVEAIGEEAALKMISRFGGDYLRIPLAREIRAVKYQSEGLSNRKIARRLGITETGADKIFSRSRDGRGEDAG